MAQRADRPGLRKRGRPHENLERLHACATRHGREQRVGYRWRAALRAILPVKEDRICPAAHRRSRRCLGETGLSLEGTPDDTAVGCGGGEQLRTPRDVIQITCARCRCGLGAYPACSRVQRFKGQSSAPDIIPAAGVACPIGGCRPVPVQCCGRWRRRLSSRLAKAWRSLAPKAAGPPVSTPVLRSVSMKFRMSSNSRMFSLP